MKGIGDLSDAMKVIAHAVDTCHPEMLREEIEMFHKMIDEMKKNRVQLVYRIGSDIVVNGANIWHEIQDAQIQYANKNWKMFGRDMGEVLALVFFGKPDEGYKSMRVRVTEISQGILAGALKAEGLDGLEHCMEGGYGMFYDFKKAVVLFKKKTRHDTVEGLKMIGEAIKDIEKQFSKCEGVEADF